MKKQLYTMALLMAGATMAQAQHTPVSQMEKLKRSVVSVPAASGTTGRFISWSLLGTDTDNTTFDVLRDGEVVKSGLTDRTNFVDANGTAASKYQIVTKVNGEAVETSEEARVFDNIYTQMQLDRPAGGKTPSGESYTYSPNDCSVGDVDGDGEYELFVKWDPSNSHDNSESGYTGNVIIDCYKLDGTKLWRIDLGKNIRAGAHYTQFMVYDFDGDGRAEMVCKTAQGSIDAEGNYVSSVADEDEIKTVDNTKDWRNSSGKVTGGQEYLTVFDGQTGKAVHTVFYRPNRAPNSDATPNWGGAPSWTFNWSTSNTDKEYGNRGERYLGAVAYLDGPDKNPSVIMSRGYYTYAYIWAVDFDGQKLKTRWLHASTSGTRTILYDADGNEISRKTHITNTRGGTGSKTMYSNGNHNLSVGDVDGDGCDEIIWGSAALNNNGELLYATGYSHGDAIHLSDLLPDRPGMEVFQVHEESPYGWDLHDAATGEIIYSAISAGDNGRGLAADIDADHKGFEFWSSTKDGVHSAVDGASIGSSQPSINFRIYWDGDLQDELFDGGYNSATLKSSPAISKWNGSKAATLQSMTMGNSWTCNTTKSTPCLQADILGDWREEVIMWDNSDPSKINIFTTNIESAFRVPTLMHDHVYRMGIAWQNTAYNQPPHLGYYLPYSFNTRYAITGEGQFEQTVALGESMKTIRFRGVNCAKPGLYRAILPDGTEKAVAPSGFKFSAADYYTTQELSLSGTPSQLGTYKFVIKSGANVVDATTQYDTIYIHCVDPTGIQGIKQSENNAWVSLRGTQITDRFVLDFNMKEAQPVSISLYTMAGAQVLDIRHEGSNTAPLEVFGLGHLPKGIYMLKVESREGKFTKKLLKR